MADKRIERITEKIGIHHDFPKPGILFRDLFPVLGEPSLFQDLLSVLEERARACSPPPDVIVGLESRGFLLGTPLALALKVPFVPVRKKGKLPGKVTQVTYALEYGKDVFEAQVGSIKAGQNVLIVDDLLATGGSMKGACDLVTSMDGKVALCLIFIELVELKGRKKLEHPCQAIVKV